MKFITPLLFIGMLLLLIPTVSAWYTPVHYYQLESSGVDWTNGSMSLTEVNAPAFATGILGNAVDLEASSTQYLNNASLINQTKIISLDFWVKPESSTVAQGLYEISDAGIGNDRAFLRLEANNSLFMQYKIDNIKYVDESVGGEIPDGDWAHIVVRHGTGGTQIFLNGTQIFTDADTNTIDAGFTDIRVGGLAFRASTEFDGLIDNFAIFEEDYSDANVTSSFNNGFGTTFIGSAGGINITVTLNSPEDLDVNNTNPLLFKYNVSVENKVLDQCGLYTNFGGVFGLNSTDANPTNSSNNTISVSGINNGQYLWNIGCNATDGELAFASANFTLNFDTVSPVITSSMTGGAIVVGDGFLTGQINVSDDNLYSILVNDSITGVITNLTGLSVDDYQYNLSLNVSNYALGNHTFTVRTADGHTAKKLKKEYEVSTGLIDNNVRFDFDNGYVNVNPVGLVGGMSADKHVDRYKFKYNKGRYLGNEETFIVSSTHYIDILENTGYDAHMVVPDLDKWIDFQIPNKDNNVKHDITRIDDKTVSVTIKGLNGQSVEFNSIGDLNVQELNFTWGKINVTASLTSPIIEQTSNNLSFTIDHPQGTQAFMTNYTLTALYNGTLKTNTNLNPSTLTGDQTIIKLLVNSPSVTESVKNLTVPYTFTLYDTTPTINVTLINLTQEVVKLAVDDCSSYGFTAVTFKGYNEENINQTINYSMNMDVQLTNSVNNLQTNFTFDFDNSHQYSICIPDNTTQYFASATMEYQGEGNLNANRKYYLHNFSLEATNRSVNLYTLNSSIASDIIHTVRDAFDEPVVGVFLKVLRFYPELGQSVTVEIGKTDNEGKTGTKQILADPFYHYIIQDGNTVQLSTEPGRLLSTQKFFTLASGEDRLVTYKGVADLSYSFGFNLST